MTSTINDGHRELADGVYRARIEADSLNVANGIRLTTFVLTYPRIPVHEQMLTHQMLARNAQSYRVISTGRLSGQGFYVPDDWRVDDTRMRQSERLGPEAAGMAAGIWIGARRSAERYARRLAALGVHRQDANRLLQPTATITAVFSATDWWHFFRLRVDDAAQPAVQKIARMMLDLYRSSKPRPLTYLDWHLPFVRDEDHRDIRYGTRYPIDMVKLSTARLARVSYLTHDGVRDVDRDLALHDALMADRHFSPFGHPAQARETQEYHAHFRGFKPYRKMLRPEVEYDLTPF